MTLVSAAINILMLVVPVYSLQVFDRVLSSQSLDTLLLLSGIAVFLLVSQAILDTLRQKYTQRKALQFESLCTQTLYKQGTSGQASVSRYSYNDINEVRALLMSPSYFVVFDLPWTPLFLFVMFMLHPIIGLVGLVAVILILLIACISFWVKHRHFEKAHITSIATNRNVDEAMLKQGTVYSQRAGAGLESRFHSVFAEKLWYRDKLEQTTIGLTSFTKLIRLILQLAIMGIGAGLVINNQMSAGGMIAGSILMARALQPIELIASGIQGWKTALAAGRRLKGVFSEFTKVEERTTLPEVKGELWFDNVTWTPNPSSNDAILKNIKLKLEPGNRVAIIGHSGSGKTSLCQLIAGIHEPLSGRICIDGLTVTHWNQEQFKQTVGYLPQKIEFLSGSIKQNIAHFDPEVTDSQIVRAALHAGIHESILKMPDSYETLIGDGGHTLSGGQAQKLALARALCFRPKLLVLDEPNSHMDKEGEEYLVSLLTACKQKQISVVMITHQPHLLRHVDWVVELSDGQISKAGEASKILRSMMNVRQPPNKEVSNV
ncbi:ABC-type protease exporter ATP-binding component PrtD/AprD [Vibrio maritimus]|uniref:ABC-type protease exporter ATP-binding component PrtD/AprD n=1 Tax=Vibrio maritimus TaxID=990268 RepID=A0A090RV90_9VIBR|nr:ABC-type protease exporter ATP-binding component PrtD/AprD [Vibrio maritimus]